MAESRMGAIRTALSTLLFADRGRPAGSVESRAITSLPWDVGGSGVSSPHVTQEQALCLVPVYAANRLLGDSISTLPLQSYRKVDLNTRQRMNTLPQLFQTLEDEGRLTDWLHRCVTSMTLRGNAIGLIIDRDGFGFPTQITWLKPGDVHCDDHDMLSPVWYWRGVRVPTEDILHIPWFTVAGKVMGLSPIEAMQAACSTGLQAQMYGNDWFQAGGVPPGTFKNSAQVVEPEDAQIIKRRLTAAIRTRESIVYGSDWDYNAIAIPPEQAAFVETMKMTATQIASIYGIPPDMIGGSTGSSLTYATVEQNAIMFVNFTLRPWLVKMERAFSAIMPSRQYVKFNADALVRADLASRVGLYHQALTDGWRNKDEVRALEDLEPIPGGKGKEYATPTVPGAAPAVGTPKPTPKPNTAPPGGNAERMRGADARVQLGVDPEDRFNAHHGKDGKFSESDVPGGIDGGLSMDQYKTMMPDSMWSEAKREDILASLRSTPNGKILADTLDRFQDGGSISRLRTNITKHLAGEELDATTQARVEALLGALRNAPTDLAPEKLYRGISIKGKQANVLAQYAAGDPLDLNLTSFTTSRTAAKHFHHMTSKPGTTRVMVELIDEGKTVLPIQNLARDRRLFKEKEWVAAGRYEIVEAKKSTDGGVIVRIRQVETI